MHGAAAAAVAGQAAAPQVATPAPPARLDLQDLAGFLSEGESLGDWLGQAVRDIATALAAQGCSVLLLSGDDGKAPALVLAAAMPALPVQCAAVPEPVAALAREVLQRGVAIRRPGDSGAGDASRGRHRAGDSAICVPIALNGRLLGVLHLGGCEGTGRSGAGDLAVATAFAGLLARVVQAAQLQKILDQRFAQIALAESGRRHAGIMQKAMPPDRAAQIVARSLFRQMARAGFSDKQVIRTASEILDELKRSLRRPQARPPA